MKTYEDILGYQTSAIDGRDINRLIEFVQESDLPRLGVELKPEWVGKHRAKPFNREHILAQLERDLAFAFEKALNKRGISATCMWTVVSMWNWILEDGLEDFPDSDYAQYGLPLLKATALKYGFENPIGDDTGSEDRYASD